MEDWFLLEDLSLVTTPIFPTQMNEKEKKNICV